MAVGGNTRTPSENKFTRYIGFFRGHVVAINPTREDLNKLQGKENSADDEELKYTGEKDGIRTARVSIWIEVDGKTDAEGNPILLQHSISLKDKIRQNKDKTRIQVVNQLGDNSWPLSDDGETFDESGLFESFTNFTKITKWQDKKNPEKVSETWFTGAIPAKDGIEIIAPKKYRVALDGEADLYEFMQVWLEGLEKKDYTKEKLLNDKCNFLLDMDLLFNGDFSEVQELVGTLYDSRDNQGNLVPYGFVGQAYVRKDEEDEEKLYQKVYNKFLPANFIKFLTNAAASPDKEIVDCIPGDSNKKKWREFQADLTGEYGVKDGAFTYDIIRECTQDDLENNVATSNKTKVEDDDEGY